MPNFLINVKEKGAKKATKNIGGLNSALGGLAGKAALAAGSFFGAGMLLSGMKNAIDLAGKQELAEKKLEASLGRTSTALLEQARALQQVTTFGDEAIIEAQALIAAFVDDEKAVKAATAATLDLAAAKGMDLTAAADLVSKTLGSSTNALSRYGIQVEGAVGSTERLNSLTGNLADVFGGQASAQAETMAGSIEQAQNAIGDAAESIGKLLSPAVIKAARFFKGAAEAVDTYIFSLRKLDDEAIENETNHEKIGAAIHEVRNQIHQIKSITSGKVFGDMAEATHKERIEYEILTDRLKKLQEQYNETNMLIVGEAQPTAENLIKVQALMGTGIENLDLKQREFTTNYLDGIEKEKEATIDIATIIANNEKKKRKEKENSVMQDMKNAALSGQSASQAMKSVVRAETMEAVSGYLSSVLKTVPFPLNIGLAAAGGGVVAGLMDSALAQVPKFATGGDFITSGRQMVMVGDNPGGQERVQITPISSPNIDGPAGGSVNISISGNVMSQDFVEGELSEQIKEAVRRGTDFGLS